ncbi:MAG TPA: type VI secretion system accessory protein TagJ [Terriglobales bacterium]|nr:type VI secretion system accessory protein TagJ [Terriglobales bacterium]
MTAKQLFQEGKVREAQQALSAWLREHPADLAQRTFLFELLCFSGDYDRAEKHLSVLAQGDTKKEMGAILYYSALHAEKTRHDLFKNQSQSSAPPPTELRGSLNGKSFHSISDSDPRIGARLEVFAAGSYVWIPFQHLESVTMEAPRRLRDTLWPTAIVHARPDFKHGAELGEVLLPAVYPFSWKHDDESVWLGRVTDWTTAPEDDGREYPLGQKVLLVDGEEVPFLEIRSLEFEAAQAAAS